MSIENPLKNNFEAIRSELKNLKRLEEEKNLDEEGKKLTGHFELINVDELEEEDLAAYQKLKDNKLTIEDLDALKEKTVKSGNISRQEFAGFLSIKLQSQGDIFDPRRI